MLDSGPMNTRAIIYTTDKSYLIPTLVSALAIAESRAVLRIADIFVFLIGFSADERDVLRAQTAGVINFIDMPEQLFVLPEGVRFKESHVPVTTLARLYTPSLIPVNYNYIFYIDGDTQIVGDIQPFIGCNPPAGILLAASDRHYMDRSLFGYSGSLWRATIKYLASIGIEEPSDYFSAGVLAADRATWATICADALAYFFANSERCIYHDQSALNAVCKERREVLHPSYNYMTSYADVVGHHISPVVVHFIGSDKPWLFDDRQPWLGKYSAAYTELLARYPALIVYAAHWPAQRDRLGPSTSRRDRLVSKVFKLWLDVARRRRIRRHLRSVRWPPGKGDRTQPSASVS